MLTVEHLTVKYAPTDAHCALSDVSFSIREHERVALLGPNGAGKSTLLLALVGILPAQSGVIRMGDTILEIESLSEIRR